MKAMLVVALLGLAAVAVSATCHTRNCDWESFKTTYNKQYPTREHEQHRRAIFKSNTDKINTHNLRFSLGQESYEMGMNHLGDLTGAEVKAMLNGYKQGPVDNTIPRETFVAPAGFTADNVTVDWRTKGVVTPVKDQGQCGSCWAFSATGSLEAQHALATKTLVSLSEQQLVDCSNKEGNQGCNGGWMDQAFKYVLDNKGIDTEATYKYTAQDGKCKASSGTNGATLTGFVDIKARDEADLAAAIATAGPVSVAIDASQTGFQFYKSGIYYSAACSQTELDHGVLAVGLGSLSGVGGKTGDYYIVKNSWGGTWGDKGYLLMTRNKNNNCGIASKASYPKV